MLNERRVVIVIVNIWLALIISDPCTKESDYLLILIQVIRAIVRVLTITLSSVIMSIITYLIVLRLEEAILVRFLQSSYNGLKDSGFNTTIMYEQAYYNQIIVLLLVYKVCNKATHYLYKKYNIMNYYITQ